MTCVSLNVMLAATACCHGVIASNAGIALLQHARGAQRFRSLPNQAVMQTLKTLDSNHDGRVAPEEVKAFALAQSLDAEEVAAEFAGLDGNGDGTLDAAEIAAALGGGGGDTTSADMPTSRSVAAAARTAPLLRANAVHQSSSTSSGKRTSKSSSNVSSHIRSISRRRRGAAPAAAIEDAHHALATAPASRTRSAAEEAADTLVEDLSLEESSEREAQTLELQAAQLRANSTALAHQAAQRATDEGKRAALKKAHAILEDLSRLEADAAKAEEKAAELRADSQANMQQAQYLMDVADAALQPREVVASARAEDG